MLALCDSAAKLSQASRVFEKDDENEEDEEEEKENEEDLMVHREPRFAKSPTGC